MSVFRMRKLLSVQMLHQHRKFLPSTISHFSSIPDSDYAPTPAFRKQSESKREIQVEIISTEMISPSSPTPRDLRTYKLSSIDKLYPNIYPNFIFFYPHNDHPVGSPSKIIHDQLLQRRQVLKKSLSETLTKFYPFAGELKGNDECIDCNDRGAYYVEAKSNNCINDFLNHPEENSLNQLLPFVPGSIELLSQTYMILVQATIFACGGMSIGLFASHKMADGYSYSAFANAWSAIARGSSTQIHPDFSAPSIFVPTNTQSIITTYKDVLPLCSEQHKVVTKRFLFTRESLEMLKKEVKAPSRVMAVSGLLWNICMTAALKSESSSNKSNCFLLNFVVSLRTRSSPPLYSIGNIVLPSFTRYIISNGGNPFPGGIESIVKQIKHSADNLDSEFIENLKGEEGSKNVYEYMKELKTLSCGEYDYHTVITSLRNAGLYEIDFGWGKPIWVSTGNLYPCALRGNMIYLMDTRSGDGIEAWVISREEDMHEFECNQELLAFASLNPNPLQHLID